jgi:hypothetical protein
VLAVKNVLLKAEDDENQKDGPGGSVEKALRLHPQSPLFLLQKRGEVATLRMSRSKLTGSRGSAPSYDPVHRFLQENLDRPDEIDPPRQKPRHL